MLRFMHGIFSPLLWSFDNKKICFQKNLIDSHTLRLSLGVLHNAHRNARLSLCVLLLSVDDEVCGLLRHRSFDSSPALCLRDFTEPNHHPVLSSHARCNHALIEWRI